MERQEMLDRLSAGEGPLALSIEKWADIINRVGRDLLTENCALCVRYFNQGCEGCPVYDFVKSTLKKEELALSPKLNGCRRTPYVMWRKHHSDTHHKPSLIDLPDGLKIRCDTCRDIAEAELKFLKKLEAILESVKEEPSRERGRNEL